MAVSPDPRKLFEPDPTFERPLLSQVISPAFCAFAGVTSVLFANYFSRRPLLSGIQKHIAAGLAGAVIGKFLDDQRQNYFAERDAIIRHYIQLHPEDFPTPDRPRVKDLFKPWLPIR